MGRAAPGGRQGNDEAPSDLNARMAQLQEEYERRAREAHAAGMREAATAANTAAGNEVKAALENAARSAAELARLRGQLRKQAEADAIRLSLAIARRVLRRELSVDPDALRGLATAALEKLEKREICRVRTGPAHTACVSALLRRDAAEAPIEVVPDASLAPGALVFETEGGDLDASVDTQLGEIERGLTDLLEKRP